MCGIFSAFHFSDRTSDDAYISATKRVIHRGPDNIGFFSDESCFLGHTRLAIVGIDQNGNQPFSFDNLVITFNGEIYNHIELRQELSEVGYHFDTHCDTEVLIKAFHYWGEACFSKFNGMWALVIYDKVKKRVTVSRDRFGQKPLFFLKKNDRILFASEVQQLVPFSSNEVNYVAVSAFLKEGGYRENGNTFFNDIGIFPKAHCCEINISGDYGIKRYWHYWNGPIQKVENACFQKFSDLLEDAVRMRLRADVPSSVLLSGGVDSTIIAAYMRRLSGDEKTIQAFTSASNDLDDESVYAAEIARELNLKHHIQSQAEDFVAYENRLRKLVTHMGKGHSSPAIVSVDQLYEFVLKSKNKIALDGQGADELLAGYKNFFPIIIISYLFKGNFKQAALFFIDYIRQGFFSTTIVFLRNLLPEFLKKWGRFFYGYERFFKAHSFKEEKLALKEVKIKRKNENWLNRYLINQHDFGLENLLFYGDIVAMKNSIENRSPFMDYRLVDFVFSRAEKLKLWNGIDKYALKTTSVYTRFKKQLDRKKVGFASPLKPAIRDLMIEKLKQSDILSWPIFKTELKLQLERDGFLSEKYERLLFRLFQVHLWSEIFKPNTVL